MNDTITIYELIDATTGRSAGMVQPDYFVTDLTTQIPYSLMIGEIGVSLKELDQYAASGKPVLIGKNPDPVRVESFEVELDQEFLAEFAEAHNRPQSMRTIH